MNSQAASPVPSVKNLSVKTFPLELRNALYAWAKLRGKTLKRALIEMVRAEVERMPDIPRGKKWWGPTRPKLSDSEKDNGRLLLVAGFPAALLNLYAAKLRLRNKSLRRGVIELVRRTIREKQ
jgi:hypothetical protein